MSPPDAGSAFDVIVLGAGAPGLRCASALAEGGLSVAVIDRDLVGGECSYWACIPSKTLLRPGEATRAAQTAASRATVDVAEALAWRDHMVDSWSDLARAEGLARRGVELLRGSGRLVGPGAVEVDGVRHRADHVVVATGSAPVTPGIPGLAELDGVWTTRDATSASHVPARLVVLGGGPAGVELAQAFHRLGAEVALVEAAEHLLPREPAALGAALGAELGRDGIELILGAGVARARHDATGYVLDLDEGGSVRGDQLLVATGRRPRVDDIGLETVGIEADPLGIRVDERMQAADGVWAIGDATGLLPLTSVGEYQADIAAANILGEPRIASYEAVPRVVFTDPQAAAVGATAGRYSGTARLSTVARLATYTRAYADSHGFLTLVSDGHRVTGAHAVGPEAGEWLQQMTLAVRAHVPLAVLRDTIQPFPSFSEVVASALRDLMASIPTSRSGPG